MVSGNSLKQSWILNIQGHDLPKEIKKELMNWCDHQDQFVELITEELEEDYPLTYSFLHDKNIEECILLMWW